MRTNGKSKPRQSMDSDMITERLNAGDSMAATIITTVVMKQTTPVFASQAGDHTLGQIIDDELMEAAHADADIQTLTLEVNPDYWNNLKESLQRRV